MKYKDTMKALWYIYGRSSFTRKFWISVILLAPVFVIIAVLT